MTESASLDVLRLLNSPGYLPGVYRYSNYAHPHQILATITDLGWYAGYIDGMLVNDKATFLVAAGQAFDFPDYYGRNWDAFEEMVNELSWLKATGYLLLYDKVYRFAAAQPEAWEIALSILQNACDRWQREGVPFYVLLRHNWHWNQRLPKLAAPKLAT